MESKALGKGLSALIPDKPKADSAHVATLKTNLIKNSSLQPRTNYDDEKLDELKASIKEKGVLQPILVREKGGFYEVVAGERRLRAAKALDLEEIPAIIKEISDQDALVIALVENIQREDLNPIEEAESYKKLIEDFDYTHDEVAKALGKNRSTITNMMRLLNLSDTIQKSLYSREISIGHARALLGVESLVDRNGIFEKTIDKGLSVREIENLVKAINKTGSRRIKGPKEKDHELVLLEEDLQKALGTKVRIKTQRKRGKVIIEYYSLDDLDRIIKHIKK